MITALTLAAATAAVLGSLSHVEVAPHCFAPPRRRLVLDLSRMQDAWARVRGRGTAAWRRELAVTGYHLAETRALADAVLAGERSVDAATAQMMARRYPSLRIRYACVQQLRAYIYADVARSWSDPEWPARRAASARKLP